MEKTASSSNVEPTDELIVDVKNEQLILGTSLSNEIALGNLVTNTHYDDFLIDNHRVIAWCLNQIYDQNLKVTDDVFDILRSKYPGKSKATGGFRYINELRTTYTEECPEPTYTKHLWKLKTDAVKHKIATDYLTNLTKAIYNPQADLSDILETNEELEILLRKNHELQNKGFQTMEEINKAHDEEIKRRNQPNSFTSTGFRWIDEFLTDGFAPGKVTVIGGRPGMGKSAFVGNSMGRLANHYPKPIPNALFALEMDAISQIDRLNAIQTGIQLQKLIKDRFELTDDEKKAESRVKSRREKLPIYIDDGVRKTLGDIKRESKKVIERYGVRVIFIDLFMKLQTMKSTKGKSTADQYTAMLNEVQRIARELNVHFVLVVQIGRKAEARTDKRPVISDLKDAGAYEEIADNIFLFYREGYYAQKDVDIDLEFDIMEIIIGKQRQGMTGTIYAIFEGPTTRISKATDSDLKKFREEMERVKGLRRAQKKS